MHKHIKKKIKKKIIKTIIGDNGLWWQERKKKEKEKNGNIASDKGDILIWEK